MTIWTGAAMLALALMFGGSALINSAAAFMARSRRPL
jgi:hypothetical protein